MRLELIKEKKEAEENGVARIDSLEKIVNSIECLRALASHRKKKKSRQKRKVLFQFRIAT